MSGVIKHSKLKVGVLMGGKSIEREVSFNSGRTICDHLDTERFDIIPIFQTEDGSLYLLPWHFLHRGKISDFLDRLESEAKKVSWDDFKGMIDFFYISLHGRYGEDGTVQGFLEVLGIPYLGAKVFGSALIMNKLVQKQILRANGIDVPRETLFYSHQIKNLSLEKIKSQLDLDKIKLPCVVKPSNEGSSFGVTVAKSEEELLSAIIKAANCDTRITQDVLLEEKIDGMEFVSVCLQKKGVNDDWFSLAVTEVELEKGSNFYDYDQKYMPGRATKTTPAKCSKENYEKIKQTCLKVTKLLDFSAISRIDGFLTKDNRVVIIDPNSLTGMGPSTFLFHQAAELGMNHTDLINYLIEKELENYGIDGFVKREFGNNSMDNKEFVKKKVVVLLGGNNSEREISLESGRNICYKLSPKKYDVIPVFVDEKMELYKLNAKLLVQNSTREISQLITKEMKVKWSELPEVCDFVFIGLHGGHGENGDIQGTLEMLGLPYNGSGVLASSLGMDKFKTARFLESKGFDVPKSVILEKDKIKSKGYLETKIKDLTYPLILKPHDDGCSFFVKKVKSIEELDKELNSFFEASDKQVALIEEFLTGVELTCGVIGNDEITVLPPSKVLATKDILSIEEKFLPGAGENLTPAPLPEKVLIFIQDVVGKSYKALGCKGYTRIDCFYQNSDQSPTKKERVVILEPNTLPGMTPATCLFHQAAEIGLKPMEFIDKIVEFGFENHRKLDVFDKEKNEKIVVKSKHV